MDSHTFEQIFDILEDLFPSSQISLLITNCPIFPRIERQNGYIVWDETADYEDAQYFAGSPRGWHEMFARNNISHKHADAAGAEIFEKAAMPV